MRNRGHAQITTTQKFLHPMPDADTKDLTAFDRIRHPEQLGGDEPAEGGEPADESPVEGRPTPGSGQESTS